MRTNEIIDEWENKVFEFGVAVGKGEYKGENDPAPTLYGKIDAKRKYYKKLLKRELKIDSDEYKIIEEFTKILIGNLPAFPQPRFLAGIRLFIHIYTESKRQFFGRDRNGNQTKRSNIPIHKRVKRN